MWRPGQRLNSKPGHIGHWPEMGHGVMLTNQRPVWQILTNQMPEGADTWPDASGDMARVESQE